MGKIFIGALLLLGINTATFAADITGLWQTIDDKTGAPKAQVDTKRSERDICRENYQSNATPRLYA